MAGGLRRSIRVWGLTGFAFTASMPLAQAFFPPVPQPGEVITVVPPTPPDPVVVPPVPPVPPPTRPPVPPVDKPVCTCDPGPPQSVPEPMTIVLTATGLAMAAGWKLRKRT